MDTLKDKKAKIKDCPYHIEVDLSSNDIQLGAYWCVDCRKYHLILNKRVINKELRQRVKIEHLNERLI